VTASGNLLAGLSAASAEEAFETLARVAGSRIERIVSTGQASPAGFWYDQDWDEFVLLVQGEAVLTIEGEAARTLRAGDWVLLPAHRRHRVEATSVAPAAVWLAVHGGVA
jgi:cupin 2 domain-containing protein